MEGYSDSGSNQKAIPAIDASKPVESIKKVEAMSITRDSDERNTLRLSQDFGLFKTFISDSSTICFIKDLTASYVFVNPEFERVFGMPSQEILGKCDGEWLPADVAKVLKEHDQEVLKSQTGSALMEKIPDAQGFMRSWMIHRFPIVDPLGMPLLGGIAFDIMAQKQTEDQLREKGELLELILNNIGDPVIAVDESGGLLLFNPAAIKLHGLDNARGKYGLLMPDKVTRFNQDDLPLARAIRGEEVRDMEIFVRTPYDTEGMTVSASAQPLRDKDGKLRGGAAVLRDISQRKKVEEALLQALDEALAASELKSQFVSNISHELRTPMSGVLGMTELLLEMNLEPEQKELATFIYESAQNLLKVVNELLDFSRLEAGKLHLAKTSVNVSTMVEECALAMIEPAARKGIKVTFEVDDAIPEHLVGDALRTKQVLANFAANALKFTEKGSIKISATISRYFVGGLIVRFTMSDTGIGMSPAIQETLFQPFVQADGSNTRKYGGVGLGLSICRRLVKLMSGDLGVSSKVAKGSDFWFEVPLEVAKPDAQGTKNDSSS